MKPAPFKVFLSHAASEADQFGFVEQLWSALAVAGLDVFEYRHWNLNADETWRCGVLAALLVCDGAVIIDDHRSATRRWVRYEEAILKRRRVPTVRAKFSPGGEAKTTIENTIAAFKGQLRTRIPGLFSDYVDSATTAIGPLDDLQCKTCIEVLVLQDLLAERFASLSDPVLDELAEGLQAVSPWLHQTDVAWKQLESLESVTSSMSPVPSAWAPSRSLNVKHYIARQCVRHGFDAMITFARIAGTWLPRKEIRRVVDLIAPLSVPLSSVQPLLNLFHQEGDPERLYTISCSSNDAVIAAVRRAWGVERGPTFTCPIVAVAGVIFEEDLQLCHVIQHEAASCFGPRDHNDEESERVLAHQTLRFRAEGQNARRFFVVMSGRAVSERTLRFIMNRFTDSSQRPYVVPILREGLEDSKKRTYAINIGVLNEEQVIIGYERVMAELPALD